MMVDEIQALLAEAEAVFAPLPNKADSGPEPDGQDKDGSEYGPPASESSSSDSEFDGAESAEAEAAQPTSPPARSKSQLGSYACRHEGCKKWAMYGPEFSAQRLFCGEHKALGDVSNNGVDACDVRGCRGFGWFRSPILGKRTRRCEMHREEGLVPMQRRKCEAFGCDRSPVFGIEAVGTARFCDDHRLPGTARIRLVIAAVPVQGRADEELPEVAGPSDTTSSSPAPSAALPNSPPKQPPLNPKRNYRGKPISLSSPRKVYHGCHHKSCMTQASYTFEGTARYGVMCGKHRLLGMVDIRNFCATQGCRNYGWFRAPHSSKSGNQRGHCEEHREAGERPVKRQKCEAVDCRQDPEYGKTIGGIGRFCRQHRLDGHVKVDP